MIRYIKQRVAERKSSDQDGGPPVSPSMSQQGNAVTSSSSFTLAESSSNGGGRKTTTSGSSSSFTQRFGLPHTSSSNSNNHVSNAESLANKQRHLDSTMLSQKVEHLSRFDACVEACDAQAASSTYAHAANRRDPETNLLDCSVLVSPDGDLLLLPQVQQQNNHGSGARRQNGSQKSSGENTDIDASYASQNSLTDLGEEYSSAIYVGNDLSTKGEKAMNGFSANGWSIPAASLALRQSEQTLHDFSDFCEEIVLGKQESAARSIVACDKLRSVCVDHPASFPQDLQQDLDLMQSTANGKFDARARNRVGPMLYQGGTLQSCIVALEEYYSTLAESESNRWRLASLKRKEALPSLRRAATEAEERSSHRQQALREMYTRVKTMEEHLSNCKKEAQARWQDVARAEEKVTQLLEQRMIERSQKRERQQLEQFHQQAEAAGDEVEEHTHAAADIWDIVSAVNESIEAGSFAPISVTPTKNNQQVESETAEASTDSTDPQLLANPENAAEVSAEEDEDPPLATRADIEYEIGLPELTASAISADKAVQDASGSLLNVLSSLDQLRRSARIAAETCLLSSCNAQAGCLQSIIKLERAAAEERLEQIKKLEALAEQIDIRKDLDAYITADRKRPGGAAPLGDDDDGGIASALAVLTSYADGDVGKMGKYMNDSKGAIDGSLTEMSPEEAEEAVEKLFQRNELFRAGPPDNEERRTEIQQFDAAIQSLCDVASQKSAKAKSRRSQICMLLNSRRADSQVTTRIQFDALCAVISAILTGCDCDSGGGVSSAKTCMMLAQTFYFSGEVKNGDDRTGRRNRVYVKSRLLDHPIWSNEEFWDQVLYQCMSESLSNSGVLSNFDSRKPTNPTSEWAGSQKTHWYDLGPAERTEAASQVHAVVFSQLSAIAHSMMEFCCGVEMSCAFVRRMAIRNQLPLSQRSILLQHLVDRKIDNELEHAQSTEEGGGGASENATQPTKSTDTLNEAVGGRL